MTMKQAKQHNPNATGETIKKNKMPLNLRVDYDLWIWLQSQPGKKVDTIEKALTLLKMANSK